MGIIEERKELRKKIIKKASQWTLNLPLKATIILVGSYARGLYLWSDVDVLLISEEFKGHLLERLKTLDVPLGFQVIPLTLDEFKKLLEKKEKLIREAIEIGIILKDDLKIFE